MAKKSNRSTGQSWMAGLDEALVREAMEEVTVDCYNEYEQHTGLLTMIGDELVFPFRAKVIGEEVDIVGLEWPERDEFGLDLVCERQGERHRIEARSVELHPPFPDGHLFLAAYLAWKKFV